MEKSTSKLGVAMISGALMNGGLNSCVKEKSTSARIAVVDINGDDFPNLYLGLYPTADLPKIAFTIDDTLRAGNEGVRKFH